MNYSIYNNQGRILRLCSTSNILQQLNVGEYYIEGWFNDAVYYIENNTAVKIPEKPSNGYEFDYAEKVWKYTLTFEDLVVEAKDKRAGLLQKTDWTQLPDVPEATRTKWQPYRQALRDITLQDGFPQNIIWPEMPE